MATGCLRMGALQRFIRWDVILLRGSFLWGVAGGAAHADLQPEQPDAGGVGALVNLLVFQP